MILIITLSIFVCVTLLAVGASDRGDLAAALAGSPSRHLMRRGTWPVMVCPRVDHARA